MKISRTLIILIAILTLIQSSNLIAKSTKRVLMIISGYGQEQGQLRPGYEFDEFAQAFLIFKQNNIDVDVASPQGGKVEADRYDSNKSYNKLVIQDEVIMKKLGNTKAMSEVDSKLYDGIFIVGGKGAMFDLPKNKELQKIITTIYEGKGSVAAVCHGPAALANVKLSDGNYLVNGKKINGFTNREEKMFGQKWMPKFDFMLEDKLKSRGGKFQKSDILLSHIAIDGNLLTGQNPASTPKVAEALVRSIGLEPAERTVFKEERTFDLIANIWNGDNGKLDIFNGEQYDPKFVAMYGLYRMMYAETDKERSRSIILMEMTEPYFQHPKVSMALAEGYLALGQTEKAKKTLVALLKTHPEMEKAKQMLAGI